jgi:O-antigen/teichoic acid export membrane protein
MSVNPGIGLIDNSKIYAMGNLFQRLFGLISLPLFTSYISPSDFGVFAIFSTLSLFLVPVFSFGITASMGVFYFATNCKKEREEVIWSGIFVALVSCIVLFTFSLIFVDLIARLAGDGPKNSLFVIVTAISSIFTIFSSPLLLKLQFESRAKQFVCNSFAIALLNLVSSATMVVIFDMGVEGLFFGQLAGQVGGAILLVLFSNFKTKFNISSNLYWVGALLKQGLPLIPSFFLMFLLQNGIRYSLEARVGSSAVGIYSVGSNIGTAVSIFTAAVVSAWTPWALTLASDWVNHRRLICLRLTQYLMIGSLLIGLVFLFARPVISIIVAPAFNDAWTVVGLSAASTFLMSFSSLLLTRIYLIKRVYLVLIPQFFGAVSALLYFSLVSTPSPVEAAMAVLFGALILVVVQICVDFAIRSILPLPVKWMCVGGLFAFDAIFYFGYYNLDYQNFLLFALVGASMIAGHSLIIYLHFPLEFKSIKTWVREKVIR